MTKEEKENYVLLSRRRYGEWTDKKDKGAFLDQFCATTGVSRKNAIQRLPSKERSHRRRGQPFKANVAASALIVRNDPITLKRRILVAMDRMWRIISLKSR